MKKTSAPIKGDSAGCKILAMAGFLVLLSIAMIIRLLDDGQGMRSYTSSLIALPLMLTISIMIIYDSVHDLTKSIKNRQKTRKTRVITESLASIEQDAVNPDDHERQAGDHSRHSRRTGDKRGHGRCLLDGDDHSRLDTVLSIVYCVSLVGVAVLLSCPSITAALDLPHVIAQDYETAIMRSPVVERHSIRGHIYYTMEDETNDDSESFRINRQTYDKLKINSDRTVIIKYLPLSHKTMDVEVS